jgi:hypothetical protein
MYTSVSFMGQQNQSVGQVEMKNFPALMKQILPVGFEANSHRVPVVAPAGSDLRAELAQSGSGDRFCTANPSELWYSIVLNDSIAHPSGSPSARSVNERAALSLTSDSSLDSSLSDGSPQWRLSVGAVNKLGKFPGWRTQPPVQRLIESL